MKVFFLIFIFLLTKSQSFSHFNNILNKKYSKTIVSNVQYRRTFQSFLKASSPVNDDVNKESNQIGKKKVKSLLDMIEGVAIDKEGEPIGTAIGEEDDEILDIQYIAESVMDQSIERAVKQMLSDGPKEPEISPLERFNSMYKDIKSKKNGTTLDPALMLSQLFTDEAGIDPFDERKVMFKLRNILEREDFDDLFNDPSIGDWL